jgi:hypothetical protein
MAFCATSLLCCGLTACSTLPVTTNHYVDPDAKSRATHPHVAVMPPAFTIQIDGAGEVTPAEIESMRGEVEAEAMGFVTQALLERGFAPTSIDAARAQDAVGALAQGFVYHANAVAAGAPKGGTFDPALLAQIAPGVDAVLYLNGSAITVSAGKHAEQVAAGVAIGVLVAAAIAAVVLVVVLASGALKGGGSGLKVGGGGTGHVAAPGHVVAPGLRNVPGPGFRPIAGGDFYEPIWCVPQPDGAPPVEGTPPPRASGRGLFSGAELRFFATLVDAPSGKVLWHVDRSAGVSANNADTLRREFTEAFGTLPLRLGAEVESR